MSIKEEIRSRHRNRRAALSPEHREAAGAALAGHGLAWATGLSGGGPHTFAAYLGVGSEPPTLPLLRELFAAGHRVLLPVCEPGLALSWVYWTPASDFARSRYAPLQEPIGERFDTSVMLGVAGIFVPATALDHSGNRIGQGGGYYDTFLAALPALFGAGPDSPAAPLPTAGVVYDGEVLPAGSIPAESFDQKVGAGLTPSGLTGFGPLS